jgi:hypothetical protein
MSGNIKIDEDLLVKYSKDVPIDAELPFRLQKTQLFKAFGLPVKKTVPIPIQESEKIRIVFSEFLEKEMPFLIVTSPKPMLTWIPPLFRIDRAETVIYRDRFGNIELITPQQIFIKIKELPPKSWVEFTKNIWGGNTIAGRLLYISIEEQILEIQRGVEIAEMDRNPMKSFRARLSFLEFSEPAVSQKLAYQCGFKTKEISGIIESLQKCVYGFEGLLRIAKLPTVEFGYTDKDGLLLIDVDWPSQYIIKRG